MKEKPYYRYCPNCGKQVYHISEHNRDLAIKKKQLCISCAKILDWILHPDSWYDDEGKFKSHKMSEEAREKISLKNNGRKHTPNELYLMSINGIGKHDHKGNKNPNYKGKTFKN